MRAGAWLEGWSCRRGHAFLYSHECCPACGAELSPRRLRAHATLRSCTTVRVNPDGDPYRIGIAVTEQGARTLCMVEGKIRGNGRDRVQLVLREGRYVARGPA
ncbi:MAG: hypothetical protein IH969_06800 [Candidatus Krumholzibacteriota bacterium]|nr:hypothetical protein [Candidatus Krumholzibacteriota bacterium]